jgi:hypothetical protein
MQRARQSTAARPGGSFTCHLDNACKIGSLPPQTPKNGPPQVPAFQPLTASAGYAAMARALIQSQRRRTGGDRRRYRANG